MTVHSTECCCLFAPRRDSAALHSGSYACCSVVGTLDVHLTRLQTQRTVNLNTSAVLCGVLCTYTLAPITVTVILGSLHSCATLHAVSPRKLHSG